MTQGQVRIGCSGWQYRHWRGAFYPRDLPQERWLEFYAERFATVEVNNSFYRLPEADTFESWSRRTPRGFTVAVKASRYLTHLKRLRDPVEPLQRLWSRAEHLGRQLGPMLYQLPPNWHRNPERLAAFVRAVPARRLQAIEFRDRSWYDPSIDTILERGGLARCIHDMPGSASPRQPLGPFASTVRDRATRAATRRSCSPHGQNGLRPGRPMDGTATSTSTTTSAGTLSTTPSACAGWSNGASREARVVRSFAGRPSHHTREV